MCVCFGTVISAWFTSLYTVVKDRNVGISIWAVIAVCFVLQLGSFVLFKCNHDSAEWLKKAVLYAIYIAAFILLIYLSDSVGKFLSDIVTGEAEYYQGPPDPFGSFVDWFFEPEKSSRYYSNLWVLVVGINVFTATVLFYYTQIYFRISIMFIMTLFPLVLFAKDYRDIPLALLIVALTLFFAIVVHNRQMKEQQGIKVITNRSYAASVIAFLAFAMSFAVLLPKPDIVNKREWFDTFTTEYFAARYGSEVDLFNGSSHENKGADNYSEKSLFDVNAPVSLNLLKSYSLSEYAPDQNSWLSTWADELSWYWELTRTEAEFYIPLSLKKKNTLTYEQNESLVMITDKKHEESLSYDAWSDHRISLNPTNLCNLIRSKCKYDDGFAEKYGLEQLGELDSAKLKSASIELLYTGFEGELIPLPNSSFIVRPTFNSANLNGCQLWFTPTGRAILSSLVPLRHPVLTRNFRISASYYPNSIIQDEAVRCLVDSVDTESFRAILDELPENNAIANAYRREYELLDKVCNSNYFTPEHRNFFKEITPAEATANCISDETKQLAVQITNGCTSDYDKAKQLERYFTSADFRYSLDYSLTKGKGIDDFILKDREGSCFHFATAMTLMARSLGMHARYCEGYSTGEAYKTTGDIAFYNVTAKNSHAFCEVFIAGYGWMTFDPTVAAPVSDFTLGSLKLALYSAALVLFCAAITLLIIFVIIPHAMELILKNRVAALAGEDSVRYIMERLRKRHMKCSPSETTGQLCLRAMTQYDVDITTLCNYFNIAVYGGCSVSKDEAKRAYCDYRTLTEKIDQIKKEQRRQKAKQRKEKLRPAPKV